MPLLKIQTNRTLEPAVQARLIRLASEQVATLLGKSERYVMVMLEHNPAMLFAGNDEPLAYLELKSVELPNSRTGELSRALCSLIEAQLGITGERVYIEFADASRSMWGWNGGTF